MNLGIGLGGLTGGLIATTEHDPAASPCSFSSTRRRSSSSSPCSRSCPTPAIAQRRARASPRAYADVLRNRVFVGLCGPELPLRHGRMLRSSDLVPVRQEHAGRQRDGDRGDLLRQHALIVVAQLPISRALEGDRRLRALALMRLLWVAGWLLLAPAAVLSWTRRRDRRRSRSPSASSRSANACTGPPTRRWSRRSRPATAVGRYMAVHALSWGSRSPSGRPRRLRARARAAARCGRWPRRSARRGRGGARARAAGCRSAAGGSRGGSPRAARARRASPRWRKAIEARMSNMSLLPVVEDPLSTDAEPASHPAARVPRRGGDGRRTRPAAAAELSAAGLTWVHLDRVDAGRAAASSPAATAGTSSTSRT